MRKVILFFAFSFYGILSFAQSSGSITIQGSFDDYYPVTWNDGGWGSNVATELAIGRSNVHTNSEWRGSVIASFRYHVTNWGNGSNFINADIRQGYNGHDNNQNTFIAGWTDPTMGNSNNVIVIWLRGGGTTYYYNANYSVNPIVYDGVQNPLSYQAANEPALTYKTGLDSYVVSAGLSYSGSEYIAGNVSTPGNVSAGNITASGAGANSFNGNVLIGKTSQTNTSYKLDVNGNIRANQVTVNATGADYVFNPFYHIRSIDSLNNYIQKYHHLPGIPSANQMQKRGNNIGSTQIEVLKNEEEIALYIINMNKKQQALEIQLNQLAAENKKLNTKISELYTRASELKSKNK